MKINFVVDVWRDECKPGDAEWTGVAGHDGRAGITFRCPGCNNLGGVNFDPPLKGAWTWDGNETAPTVKPSILHDKDRCGWHGYLTAGEFVPC